jgi:hypothetical protein
MKKSGILLSLILTAIVVAWSGLVEAGECDNWQTNHPDWIFCDDFESTGPLVAPGRYFDQNSPAAGGSFSVDNGVGYAGSRGVSVLFPSGSGSGTEFGSLHLAFGRNPVSSNGISTSTDFTEVYWRFYMKLESGWAGVPQKLTRAIVFSGADMSSATMDHLWNDNSDSGLMLDPSSCVSGSTVICSGWNDLSHYTWLGGQSGITQLFDGNHNNQWYRIEVHLKLNTPGQSDGVFEYWVDGNLEARQTGLNLRGSYTVYGINAIYFPENYSCTGANGKHRYFDNFVVSRNPIGSYSPPGESPPFPPTQLRVVNP